ncbi:amidohydrolase [Sedimentitalea arenosa]|uniref:Amidohydrolase n=1 Tax=Sedimentitalea arenosa TaxID=2798803 RepID=A0A8J7LSA0_9RHOB|nr:amidohydrolase [Arenibacterium arenosum]MBJ6372628.1 amidohydrolase [Arenibacterium arenosum]
MPRSSLAAVLALLPCLPLPALSQEIADRIFFGGPVLTMDDTRPRTEAVAVLDGRIIAVGPEAEIMVHRGDSTELTQLDGRALIPGFFDAHAHVMMGGLQALSANLLAPPDGDVTDIDSLLQTLRDWVETNREVVERVNLIIGFGYDNAMLAEQRHPTRHDLDKVSTEIPIYLIHQSGHLGAGNSKALDVAGLTADTPDPAGGVIRRDPDGTPNGVLEETAHIPVVVSLLSRVGVDGFKEMTRAGADLWARFGFTSAEEGRSIPQTVEILREVAREDGFAIDVVTYPDVLVDRDWIAANVSPDYENRVRVAGAKLTIDGSPQGFTAWRDRPYYDPVGDYPAGYVGYPAATAEQVTGAIDWAYGSGVQIITHSNGEAASDLLIAAHRQAQDRHGTDGDLRPVLIHGQFLREDQVDAMKTLGITPSLFPMHTFYWGDWHRDHTVGPALADDISPTGWVHRRGMRFSSHTDAPVALPDSMRVLDATVTRRSRTGDIIGPDQRIDVMTALKAMTLWPAWHHHEDHHKGSIEVGKLADLVILSADPTAVPTDDLDQLVVEQTIKEGVTIHDRASQDEGRLQPGPQDGLGTLIRVASARTAGRHRHGHGPDHGLHMMLQSLNDAVLAATAGN